MRRFTRLLFVLSLLAFPSVAGAADNAVVLTVGTGTTMRSIDVGAGVQAMGHILVSTAGAAIYGTAGTANANVLTVQGVAAMTPLLVTATVASGGIASGAIAAGAQVDLLTMRGTKNAGTAAANSLLAGGVYNSTPLTLTDTQQASFQFDANGYLKANVVTATGVAQGSTTSGQTGSLVMGAVTTSAPSYTTAQTSPMSLTTSGATRMDQTSIAGSVVVADPCEVNTPTYTPISITSATTTRIVAPTSAKKTYICHIFLQSAIANNVGIVEGTGGTCGSGTAGVVGGTTAANGVNLAANQGFIDGNGRHAVWSTAGTNVDLCLITSAAGPLSGTVKSVAQ